ncbi:MAG: helix-turn-helix transcriptional regulator [Phaeodactylibacter sp.]|nr:helix-turn-helix transcriptional regulator [Phaeodactylibacter sp.]
MEAITRHLNNAAPQFIIVYQPTAGNNQMDESQRDGQPAPAKATAGHTPRFLMEVLAIMEANVMNAHFTVEDLSQMMGMSYSSLNRKLGRHTGKRAVQLLRGMRLQRACVLLQRGELSISEVAYETGFTTPAYFSRIFSREMGFPPSEYQGVNRNKI